MVTAMANSADPHIDGETLEKYSIGDVSAKTTARVEEHLLACDSCRQNLMQVDVYVAAMRHAAEKLRRAESKPVQKRARKAASQT